MEKARTCKPIEELSALVAETGIELSDEELGSLSGGNWLTNCPKEGCEGYRDE